MNKQEFIETLRYYLVSLPEDERNELIRDYELHFIHGEQNGKTETDISRELGDPLALAREVIGHDALLPPPWTPSPARQRPDIPRFVGVSIVLFFLNLIAIPVCVALWATCLALGIAAIAGILSPLILVLETYMYNSYAPVKLFTAIGMVGIGMLLASLTRYFSKGLLVGTNKYSQWNYKTWRGR